MNLKSQLIDDERSVPYVYLDTRGIQTAGVGRRMDKLGGLRPSEIDFMLDNDIAEKTAQVLEHLPWVEQMNEPRRAALIRMCFQLGINGLLGFTRSLAAIRDGHYDLAETYLLESDWAKQTPDRAKRTARQIATGEWQ